MKRHLGGFPAGTPSYMYVRLKCQIFCLILVDDLHDTSAKLMGAALKQNTHRTYSSAQNRFLKFCDTYNQVAMPVSEDTIVLYVIYLFEEGLVGASIRVYLSAVRSLHIFSGHPYPIEMHRVKLALKGAVRQSAAPIRKMPITFEVLQKILPKVLSRFDGAVLSAAMALAFFGCMRLGEVCVPD